MPRILILGSNGYIGLALADTLVRSGNHTVYGVVRSADKALPLAQNEILPIICADPRKDGSAWQNIVREEHIDVIVDAMAYAQDSMLVAEAAKALGQERLEAAKKEGRMTQKLGYIFVSGMWVHGSNLDHKVNDALPVSSEFAVSKPVELVAARAKDEQTVLAMRDAIDVAIVRPGLVYGRASWILDSVFGPIVQAMNEGKEKAEVAVDADAMPGLVHVDDVATGIQALVEKLPSISTTSVYPVFDLSTTQESYRDILGSAARHMGFKRKVELVGPGDSLFMKAMSASLNGDSSRARLLLGWTPRRYGLVQNIQVVFSAWKATQEAKAKA